jgi:Alpha/beta hydrolase domain
MLKALPAPLRLGLRAPRLLLAAAAQTLLLCSPGASARAATPVPLPKLSRPLPDPVRQGIGIWSVRQLGYSVTEYLVSGRANIYMPVSMADARDFPSRNNVQDLRRHRRYHPELRARAVPYTTRIVVYEPADPARFSGHVIFEVTHPAGGGRLTVWGKLSGFFISQRDAYVAIQHPLTFDSLRDSDPHRYGTLYAKDPTQLWGMVAQVGALVRSASPQNPLAGYRIRSVFLTGYSYSGVVVATFADYYHDGARLPSGQPIFDGYIPLASQMYVRPLDAPVMRVNTQSDFNSFGALHNRGADSDAPGYRYRLYEVAGASHVNASPAILPSATAPRRYPRIEPRNLPHFSPQKCWAQFPRGAMPNTLPLDSVIAQAFLNLYRWVDRGIAPPRAPWIETNAAGKAKLGIHGNALGGLRLPEIRVPAATYGAGSGACFLFGYERPFSSSQMHELYGTRSAYVQALARAARQDVAEGFISASSARHIIASARAHTSF